MANSNQFVTWATGAGANVIDPTAFAALSERQQGAQDGELDSDLYNTPLRQISTVTTMLAQFTADLGPSNVLDNGNVAQLETQFIAALTGLVTTIVGPNNFFVGADIGSADNVHVVVMSPAVTAYANNQVYMVTIAANNATSSPNFQIGSLAVLPIKLADGTACPRNYLRAGARVMLVNAGATVRLIGGYRATIPNMNGVIVRSTTLWTVPGDVIGLENVWVFGAGGGGKGAVGASDSGFGGAGGGITWKAFLPVTSGASILMTIGAPGAGGAAGADGAQGGTTILNSDTPMQATGGGGGTDAGDEPVLGGVGSGGDLNLFGDPGNTGGMVGDGAGGPQAVGGEGGSTTFGGGITRKVLAGPSGANGPPGKFPAGGGGGAASAASGSSNDGGDGSSGLIIFSYRTASI